MAIDYTRDDAVHLMAAFEKWIAATYGMQQHGRKQIGNVDISWSVGVGRSMGRYTTVNNWGVLLNISGPNLARTQKKIHRSLKTMQARVQKIIGDSSASMVKRETSLFENAEEFFNLGYCAMRMGRQLRREARNWQPAVQVKGTITGGKTGWITGVRYSRELDTLIVPTLRVNGTEYFIPLEQSDVVFASVTTHIKGVALK